MDNQTLIQAATIAVASGLLFFLIGGALQKRKWQPIVEAERKQCTELELRRQREERDAQAREKIAAQQLQAADLRHSDAETRLANAQSESITKLAAAQQRIADHEAELLTARQAVREVDMKLAPTTQRIADLDSALQSERGRLSALQAALDAKHDLAQQLALELNTTRSLSTEERQAAAQREAGLRATLAEHERVLASGMSQAEHVQIELDRVKAEFAAITQDHEIKLADAKRKVATADQKNMLLQKEIMSLVSSGSSSPSEAAATVVAAEDTARLEERAKTAERRVQELEAKLSMSDSETRKKLRESEYRVCELEFKMAEMADSYAVAPVPAVAPTTLESSSNNEQPSPEYLAKLHEDLAAAKMLCEVLAQERDLARKSVASVESTPSASHESELVKSEPKEATEESAKPVESAPEQAEATPQLLASEPSQPEPEASSTDATA